MGFCEGAGGVEEVEGGGGQRWAGVDWVLDGGPAMIDEGYERG